MINVEVGYAKVDQQVLVPVSVQEDATVLEAIESSGILKQFPEIDLAENKVGIFSKACKLDHKLRAGDRVEIYRPLLADPKESRRQRAGKNKSVGVDHVD